METPTIQNKIVPKISVGRYAGTPIDQLPNSYLRWMIAQKFPKEWVDCALEKLEKSDYNNIFMSISRHALDMFSKRFLTRWIQSEAQKGERGDGIATFITKCALEAWEKGTDVSKNRHQDDGVIKSWQGIRWVFNVSPSCPDYRDVVTVTNDDENYPQLLD